MYVLVGSINSEDFKSFEAKYKERIKKEFEDYKKSQDSTIATQSRQYQEFKQQWMPKNLTIYEKVCNFSEKVLKIAPDANEAKLLQESIDICHLNATPAGIKSFSFVGPLIFIVVVSLLSVMVPILMDPNADLNSGLFFVMFAVVLGGILIIPLGK